MQSVQAITTAIQVSMRLEGIMLQVTKHLRETLFQVRVITADLSNPVIDVERRWPLL